MTTTYTYPVKEGEITNLREYALHCTTRMFPWSSRGKLLDCSKHAKEDAERYKRSITKAEIDLKEFLAKSDDVLRQEFDEENAEIRKNAEEYIANVELVRQRYTSMLDQVNKWDNCSPLLHDLRELMITQLEKSMVYDIPDDPKKNCTPEYTSFEVWKADMVGCLEDTVTHFKEKLRVAIVRAAEDEVWVHELLTAFPEVTDDHNHK